MLKGAPKTKKEKTEAAVATRQKSAAQKKKEEKDGAAKSQPRKNQKSAAQKKKEAEADKKRRSAKAGSKAKAKVKAKAKAAPARPTRSTRSVSATTKSATTRSKRKRGGDASSDSSSSSLSDVEPPATKRRMDARKILETEVARKRAERAKEQAEVELRAARKAAKDLEQKARGAAVRAEAAARAAEAARTPVKSPRAAAAAGGGPADAPLEMWKVYICWRDEELPIKIRSDATVGSLAWLISNKTDGKLQADRCELTFGVTRLASVPNQELLATIGVVQGARFGLTLRPKGAAARPAPSPLLSPRAKAAAKARLAAARGVERAAMAGLDAAHGQQRANSASGRTRTWANQPWSEPEALALVDGVAAFGLGEWARILDAVWLKHVDFPKRSATDLKDKWRNLCNSADKPEGFKFRLAYVTPELLARTREVRAQTQLKKRENVEKWEAELAARRAEIRRRSVNAGGG